MTYRLNRFTVTILGAGKGTGDDANLQIDKGQRDRALAIAAKWHGWGYAVAVRDNLTSEIIYAEI